MVSGSNIGQGKGEGVAEQIVPVKITFDKTNTITIGILGESVSPCLVTAQILVTEAFNAAGTDTISVGSAPAGTDLFNGQTVAATGLFTAAAPIYVDTNIDIEIAYAFTSTAPTTGEAFVLLKVTPVLNPITQEE